MARSKVVICPYCGQTQPAGTEAAGNDRCRACGGLFEPLSRQASHNAMGPWFIRDERRPFQPGCSYETLIRLVERSQVTRFTIIRGPTTKQFWTVAKRVPGIAHLLGYCHSCDASVDASDHGCHACGVPFGAYFDRNFLGLPDVRPLPWEPQNEEHADASGGMGGVGSLSSRMIDFRRAAEPLGISSFASDEELRTPPAPKGPASVGRGASLGTGGASTQQPTMSPVMAPEPGEQATGQPFYESQPHQVASFPLSQSGGAASPSSLELLQASPSGVAARAMQRRLAQQQATIKILAIGMIALAMAMGITIIVLLSRDSSGTSPHTSPQTATSDANGASNAAPALPADVSDGSLSTADQELAADETRTSTPERNAQTIEQLRAEYERALQLLQDARSQERDIASRVQDYEAALAILRMIEASALGREVSEEISVHAKQAQDELDALKLDMFFP